MEDCFLPLGGAEEIGASSYFLRLDQTNLLLDCGARIKTDLVFPDYDVLLKSELEGYHQIDAILITHAHYDHIGALYSIASKALQANIYATKITKELIRLQLVNYERCVYSHDTEKMRRMKLQIMDKIIDRIIEVPVMKAFKVNQCEITFLPAGHMAGACMAAIQSGEKKVLYTGDFSFNTIGTMNQFNINGFHPDVLIMNSTYGYEFNNIRMESKGFDHKMLEKRINGYCDEERNVLLYSQSIPKHLDLFYALKLINTSLPCYLHHSSKRIADAFTELNYGVYGEYIKNDTEEKKTSHIMISSELLPDYEIIDVDYYSLHVSFQELCNMVYLCMPRKVLVVHTQVKDSYSFMDELENAGRYTGEMIQCYNGEKYLL